MIINHNIILTHIGVDIISVPHFLACGGFPFSTQRPATPSSPPQTSNQSRVRVNITGYAELQGSNKGQYNATTAASTGEN